MDELLVLSDEQCSCFAEENNISANTQEMLEIFNEAFPFNEVDTIYGKCIKWDEAFIEKSIIAMTTGSLLDFSEIEKQVWFQFVEFQDAMTHSATTDNFGAVGCTIPDENGKSYVVTDYGITTTLCQNPASTVNKKLQSKSLDDYFMDLYNCEIPNDCGIISGEIQDISPCNI